VFLAQGLTKTSRRPDGPEEVQMKISTMPLADLPLAIQDGRICDAKTILALYYAQLYLGSMSPQPVTSSFVQAEGCTHS